MRSTGHGAGPTSVISPRSPATTAASRSHSAASSASCAVACFGRAAEDDVREPNRSADTADRAAPASSCAHERVIVVRHGAPHRVVRRHARLDDHLAALRPAPRAARDLAQELEAPLGRAEVRQVDPDVRVDDADERHVREVEPLRDHLRAEENVDLAAPHAIENLGVRPLAARRVDVHARDARGRKALGEQPLDLLRAQPALAHALRRRTCGTSRRGGSSCRQ